MEQTVKGGLARAIGVSNFSSKKLEHLLEYAVIKPAFDQVEMHPGWQQQTLRAFCKRRGIHVAAFSALGAPGTFYGRNDILSLPVILELASKHKKTPAQICTHPFYCINRQFRKNGSIPSAIMPYQTTYHMEYHHHSL